MKKLLFILISCTAFTYGQAQTAYQVAPKQYNLTSVSTEKKVVTQELTERTPLALQTHPEYGVNPYNAPCTDCIEILEKRTESSRYFITNNSNGSEFYAQQSYGAMHYKNAQNQWVTIDTRLKPGNIPHLFTAANQPMPVKIDAGIGFTSITRLGAEFKFNRDMELFYTADGVTTISKGKANWANYTVGDDGVKVIDAWPGIDMVIKVNKGQVESDFIVKHALGNTEGRYLIRDYAQLPNGFHYSGITPGEPMYGEYTILTATGEEAFHINRAFAFEGAEPNDPYYLAYNYSAQNGYVDIELPAQWINNPARHYPVTIDPLVTASGSLSFTVDITGSGYDPVCFQNGCQYPLSVMVPAACTVTDITNSFQYNTFGGCTASQGAISINYGACKWPQTGIPTGCTLPGPCTWSGFSIYSDLQACIPAPQCAGYAMPFTLNFYRCASPGGCSSTCIGASQNWVMTVKGKTVETLSITGAQANICPGTAVNLQITPTGGVPPYSIVWNPGALVGSPVTVNPTTNTLYTATVTDACGNTITSNNTVNVTIQSGTNNPGFSIGTANICAGVPFNIFGGGGGVANGYDWVITGSNQPTVNNSQNVTALSFATAGSYSITLNYNNNGCFNPLTQNVTVNPVVTPVVAITANPSGPVCSGACVNFTAVVTNGGTGTISWRKNGSLISSATLPAGTTLNYCNYVNGDIMTAEVTNNAACVSPATGTSNPIVMQVTATVVPGVTITQSPANPVCPGTPVTFTATPVNGGPSPTYVWQLNGNLQASTPSNTYTVNAPANGNQVAVTMTSSLPPACIFPSTGFSNVLTITTAGTVTPSVSITQSPAGAICLGTNVTFTATPVNGGASPQYEWFVNNVSQGAPSSTATFSSNSLTNGQTVRVVITSNANCPTTPTATSNTITMTVNPALTPSVSIASNPAFPVCSGSSVTFTATPTNGGANPTYQWFNGATLLGSGATYTSAALPNGASITAVLTSNATCVTPTTATSNAIVVSLTAQVTPAVTITANPGNTVCAGTSVTYTATPTNGGSGPTYQWKRNGTNVGVGATYTNPAPANGDVITCVLTSNDPCANPTTATSNAITMTVNPNVAPSVTIAANPGNTICTGASVTFTATPTNGGAAPLYEWFVNNVSQGAASASATFTTTTLANNDVVRVTLTSNATCVTPTTATSSNITMTVNTVLTPSVAIAANPAGAICSGTNVTFTATPTNGGGAPLYEWFVNNVSQGAASASNTFSSAALTNGQTVRVTMTSNATCVSPTTATSSNITITVNTTLTPSVSITANPGNTVCQGTAVTFTASVTSGGTTPTYQWYNGAALIPGAVNSTYLTNSLANGDQISVRIVSSDPCANPTNATSNTITMTVNPNVIPSVTVSSNPGSPVCQGASVTFTATPTNGGAAPTYQWFVGGTPLPPPYNTAVITPPAGSIPAGTANITVQMTSNAPCASPTAATSPVYPFTVNPLVPPTATISVSPNTPVCAGSNLTFTAVAGTAGTAPTYQWYNGATPIAGATNLTYSSTGLTNGQQISVVVTSNDPCAAPLSAQSTPIAVQIISQLIPSVGIAALPASPICAGTSVTFTATPTNGGASPTYQWFINNVSQGPASASNTFTSATLANNDVITVTMTSSEPCANPTTANSNSVTMTVNPVQTPTVSIAATPASPICAGTSVTFTATPTNGGAAPTYQWLNNGVAIVPAQTAATYTTTTLTSADNISVRMTSNVACPSPATVTSNVLNYVVNPVPVPSVTLAANPNTPICPGTSVTFTATPTNGGAGPLYEFFVNNVSQGAASASATFSSTTLANGDAVRVTMTSNALCASPTTATSANVSITVLTVNAPTVTLTQSPSGAICAGQNVTFSATPTFGGPTPTYQWAINGTPQPGSSSTFSTTALANNDAVTVTLTSSLPCASPTTVTSTPPVTVTVNPILVPTITVVQNPTGTVCQGTPITFTATPSNEGITPTYQWFVNNSPVAGSNSPIYINNNPANGDVVKVTLTSSEQCAQPQSVTSTDITLSVVSTVVPTVTITPSQTMPVCDNTAIVFTADTSGGGPAPTFQWLVNTTPQAGATGATFNYTPANGDNISVVMTSNAQCANPTSANANINASTLPYLDPTITITSNPTTSVCLGQTVTFTATVADAGTSPFIQWYVGGAMVGTNATTYVSNTINPGDIIVAEVTSSYQCVNTPVVTSNQIQLTFNPPITVTVTPSNTTVCASVKTVLTATATGGDGGPYVFTWDDGTPGDVIQVSPNSTTNYTVSATDGCGTTPGTATATITVVPTPVANFTYYPDDKVTTLDDVFFDNQSSNADWWTWDFGDNTALVDTVDQPYHNFENPSSYQVTLYAYNASGCTDTIVRTIEVKEQAIFYVPNAFTPNKDGKNELFRVYTTNVDLPYTLVIYARNGEEVYNSENDAKIPGAIYWTGQKHNEGKVLPEGVYVYYLYIKNPYLNKKMWTKRGIITMLTGEPSN